MKKHGSLFLNVQKGFSVQQMIILDVSRIETGQLSYRFEVYLHGTFSYIMKTNRKLKERAPVLDIGRYRVVGIITKDYKGIYSMVRMNNIL
jgi:hypothetical protein